MSSQIINAIPRAQDRSILAAFQALAQHFAADDFTVNTIAGADATIKVAENTSDLFWQALSREDGCQIRHAAVSFGNSFQVIFYRGGFETGTAPSPYWDHIGFNDLDRSNRIDAESRLVVGSIVQKHLGALTDLPKAGAEQDKLGHLFTQYDAALGTLRAMSSEFLVDLAKQRATFDQEMINTRQRLQSELDEKKDRLDKLHSARSEVLDTRIKAVDDSDNKHARRAIRDKMLEDVSSRIKDFGVSANTEGKRKRVLGGFLFLFFVFSIIIGSGVGESVHHLLYGYETAMQLTSDAARTAALEALSTEKMIAWARTAIGGLGLTASIVFFIRWESRWADMHAINEFQLQQFHVDVNRANWVIESALEWKKETDEIPPSDLLAQLTKNLFANQSDATADKVLHPADELASALLGSSSKLSLNVAGNEMVFDKPGKIPRDTKVQG